MRIGRALVLIVVLAMPAAPVLSQDGAPMEPFAAPPAPRLSTDFLKRGEAWDHHGTVTGWLAEQAKVPPTRTNGGEGHDGGPRITLGRLLDVPLAEVKLGMRWQEAGPLLAADGWASEDGAPADSASFRTRVDPYALDVLSRLEGRTAGQWSDPLPPIPASVAKIVLRRTSQQGDGDGLDVHLYRDDDLAWRIYGLRFDRSLAQPLPPELVKTYAFAMWERYGPPTYLRETVGGSDPGRLTIEGRYLPAGYPMPDTFDAACVPVAAASMVEALAGACPKDLDSRVAVREALVMSDRSGPNLMLVWTVRNTGIRVTMEAQALRDLVLARLVAALDAHRAKAAPAKAVIDF